MAPAFGLGLGVIFGWLLIAAKIVSVGLVGCGLAFLLIHNKAGSRSSRGRGVLCFFVGIGMLVWLYKTFDSPRARASVVLDLPKEAQILSVKEGELAGDGSVTFKLPPNHSVKFWLDTVWKMNALDKPSHTSSTERYYVNFEGFPTTLAYDATTQIYSYESES